MVEHTRPLLKIGDFVGFIERPPQIEDELRETEADWLIAHTDPMQEAFVGARLRMRGHWTYNPVVAVTVRFGRATIARGVRTWRTRTVYRAHLPTYVFVQDNGRDDQISRIKAVQHVQGLVRFGERIAAAWHSDILKIRAKEVDGVVVDDAAKPANELHLDPGDTVRVIEGNFAGFFGDVLSTEHDQGQHTRLAPRSRIIIGLHGFGSLTPVEMALHQVELVTKAEAESSTRR